MVASTRQLLHHNRRQRAKNFSLDRDHLFPSSGLVAAYLKNKKSWSRSREKIFRVRQQFGEAYSLEYHLRFWLSTQKIIGKVNGRDREKKFPSSPNCWRSLFVGILSSVLSDEFRR